MDVSLRVSARLATIALSYVWPAVDSENATLELKMNNLGQFQEEGFFHDMEIRSLRVISDAVELVKQLHERCLWIDRLCIV